MKKWASYNSFIFLAILYKWHILFIFNRLSRVLREIDRDGLLRPNDHLDGLKTANFLAAILAKCSTCIFIYFIFNMLKQIIMKVIIIRTVLIRYFILVYVDYSQNLSV